MKNKRLKLKRQRAKPTDATGCGFAFFAFVIALFVGQVSIWMGVLFLLAIPCCLVWQIKIWRYDWRVHRDALDWCREHYPDAGGTPIVDLMIAVVEETPATVDSLLPTTLLDSLNIELALFNEEIEEHFLLQDEEIPIEFLEEVYLHKVGLGLEREETDITVEYVRNGLRQNFIYELLFKAHIRKVDLEAFEGTTLDDLIHFVITKSRR